jgi:predicted ATP-dependent serine protease
MLKTPTKKRAFNHYQLHKPPTGIKGFDEITKGGLPKNRTTLFSGSTGTGKTLLGIDFLINGATRYDEPGVHSGEPTERPHLRWRQNRAGVGCQFHGITPVCWLGSVR